MVENFLVWFLGPNLSVLLAVIVGFITFVVTLFGLGAWMASR